MAVVTLSVTTLDRDLARKLEPRAPTPPKRLAAIGTLAALRIPTGVLTAPMIPALNDMELERILEAAAKAGASGAGYVLLRLPLEIADLFKEWLETHYPDKAITFSVLSSKPATAPCTIHAGVSELSASVPTPTY